MQKQIAKIFEQLKEYFIVFARDNIPKIQYQFARGDRLILNGENSKTLCFDIKFQQLLVKE